MRQAMKTYGYGLLLLWLLVAALPAAAQTIPTRTPTPAPGPTNTPSPPDPTPPGDGGGGGQPPPTATAETVATAAPTDTPPPGVTLAATPQGGYLATAEPCGLDPTVQSLSSVINVRTGPGLGYVVVYQMTYLEVRPIIGKAAEAPWWLIRLSDGREAWVADAAVVVAGNTSAVPLAMTPPLAGSTATPGPAWLPTLDPACTPLPSRTPTPTQAPATPTLTASPVPSSTAEPTATASPPATATALPPTNTAVPPATATPTAFATVMPTATPAPSPGASGGASATDALLVLGLLLLSAGGAVYLVRARRSS